MRILITGCSSGIGLAIAQRLLRDGHELIGYSRRRPAIDGERFSWHELDLGCARLENAERLRAMPIVEGFVHAAGIMQVARLGDYDHADAERMWRLHVSAPSLLMSRLVQSAAPLSRIVMIGSRTQRGAAGKSAYAASKSAQGGLVRSWALELMSRQVTVNLVAPGATDTPMLHDPARAEIAPALPPMGRFVSPAEIAGAVSFLISEDARSVTGQTLTVCAGASL